MGTKSLVGAVTALIAGITIPLANANTEILLTALPPILVGGGVLIRLVWKISAAVQGFKDEQRQSRAALAAMERRLDVLTTVLETHRCEFKQHLDGSHPPPAYGGGPG